MKHEFLWIPKGKKPKTYTRVVLVLVLVAGKTRKNEKMKIRDKKKKKKVTKSKESKELREGSPTNSFLVANCGLRRAERWKDMPSMSSEVGEI